MCQNSPRMQIVVDLSEASDRDNDPDTLEREQARLLGVLRRVDDSLSVHRHVHSELWDDFVLPHRSLAIASKIRQAVGTWLPARYSVRQETRAFSETVLIDGDGWPRNAQHETLVVRRLALPKRAARWRAGLALLAFLSLLGVLVSLVT